MEIAGACSAQVGPVARTIVSKARPQAICGATATCFALGPAETGVALAVAKR